MPESQPTGAQIGAVQHTLEQELPSRVLRTWWDGDTMAQVFELSYDAVAHRVEIAAAFFADCPDYAAGLRDSELADHMRETRSQGKHFTVLWQGRGVRLRIKLL